MNKKPNELEAFGKLLYQKRIEKKIGLREICRKVNFDPSNWSKIERGKLAPPSDTKILSEWALALGIKKNSDEYHSFVEYGLIAQGIIPNVINEKEMLKLLPAFFRTYRNGKPSKEDLDKLLNLLKESM